MTCEFNSTTVPHSLLPSSIVLRFLIFLPVHALVHCSCLLFLAFPFVILAVRRGFEGAGEEREGMEAPTQARRARYTSTGWRSSGGRGGCSLGKDWLAPAGCTRSPTAVHGSSYLYLTPSSLPPSNAVVSL